ncbi:MAG: TlpA family protein disulfide reductase [Phycisphaerae bacterium]
MSKAVRWLLTVVAVLGTAPLLHAATNIGDTPPPLVISDWVKGEPVDLARELGKKVFMIEFWATWCPPCKMSIPRLTEFQKKYKKDLTIVGVTAIDDRGNTGRAIKRFVKQQGSSMMYTVAIDKGTTTWGRYMEELAGIPHAFLVGRNGKVVWQGSPLEPSLAQVIPEVIAGTYDLEKAKIEAEVNKLLQTINYAMQVGHWSVVWDLSVAILKLDPANELAMANLLGMYLDGLKDGESLTSWARSHIAQHRDDAPAMQQLADILSSNPDITKRTPALALEAAKAAYDAPKGRGPVAIAAFARVVYQLGDLDRAIKLQEEALAAAGPGLRERLQLVLDYYLTCKELRARLR